MASTDSLNADQLAAVARQLGPFLPPFSVEIVPPAPFGIAESFQVWVSSLQDFRTPGAAGPSWYHVWHHQLRLAGARASTYVRALEHDGAPPEIRGVYQADVAGEIDLAISSLDDNPQLPDDAKVRLLEIPDVFLMALWISSPVMDQYIPLAGFASPDPEHFAPISKQQLLGRLPEQPISALSLEAPPDRRPDFQELE